jgi:hypothetical protein
MIVGAYRRVLVLRQIEIPWSELKAGEVFRTEMAGPGDLFAQPDVWQVAITDAEQTQEEDNYCLQVEQVTYSGRGPEKGPFKLMPPEIPIPAHGG